MKRFFRIFDLLKNEQRVVLIVMLVLVTITFVGYARRVHHRPIQPTAPIEARPSPTAAHGDGD